MLIIDILGKKIQAFEITVVEIGGRQSSPQWLLNSDCMDSKLNTKKGETNCKSHRSVMVPLSNISKVNGHLFQPFNHSNV